MRALGHELARCAAATRRMSSTRLWTKNTCPPRASSRSIASRIRSSSKRADEGADRAAVGGRRGDDRDVAQARHRHVQRARDRRRGQRQHVDLRAQLLEPLLVRHAEALLLVDDEQAEVLEAHVAPTAAGACRRRRRPCPRRSAVDRLASARPCCETATARRRVTGKSVEALGEGLEVLLGEHGGRRQHRDLLAAQHRLAARRASRPRSCRSRRRRRPADPSARAASMSPSTSSIAFC